VEINNLREPGVRSFSGERDFGAMAGTKQQTMVRVGAFAGMVGPILFGTVLVVLTVVQYDFMIGIGWRPLQDPAGAWPSGLALGPYSWVQVLNFVVSGLLLMLLALGLHCTAASGHGSRVGPILLFVAGAAMTLMGFNTDPILREGPRTLHGLVHDLAFTLFVLSLLTSLFFLWRRLRRYASWRGHARYTLATGVIATLLISLPGVAYYLFIVVVLAWMEVTAIRLLRHSRASDTSSPRT
jgi:Protein of unknown function (DUF998)